jgi:hypothetical protein
MIEAALRSLPIKPPTDPNAIPYSITVPRIARELAKLGSRAEVRGAMVGSATTRKELAAVQKGAKALLAVMHSLHSPARIALAEIWPSETGYFMQPLLALLAGLEAAAAHAVVPELPPNAGRGAPPKKRADHVAACVAFHYKALTGRKAAPNNRRTDDTLGPFVSLLAVVFKANGIDASAEHYAKPVEQIRRKNSELLPVSR